MKLNVNYDVIIIGAGPAGMTASIYLKRAGISPLILEAKAPGGTLNEIYKLQNYPGYTEEDGTTLAFRMYSQLENLNIPLETQRVINIEKEENLYKVICENKNYYAKYILIASGKTPRKLICKNSNKYEGKGISYCTICDGALYKNKTVIVLGGGNTAMESAKYMSNIANKIYIVNRSPLRADLKEQEIIKDEKVEVILNATIKEVIGDENHITEVILNDDRKIKADAIFVCIGKELSSAYYQNLNIKTDNLGIIVDKDMKTSNSSIYAAGDVISKSLYQVVTATGEGALAASSIIKSLKK